MTGFTFGYFDDNRLQQVTDGAGTAAFTYTPGGQVASVTYNYGASGLVPVQRLDYLYNPDGSRASMTWTNGATVIGTWVYQYDAGGRLTGITNPWAESTGWGYDGEGKLKHQQNHNGTRTEWNYFEARGWPTSITHKLNGNPFASYGLTYDNGLNTVGLLTGVVELDGSTVGFGYDALYRLRSDSRTGLNPFSHSYDPDLAGNPVTVNGQPFATFDDANKIATIAGGSASHDGDGNLTGISGTNVPAGIFAWDDLSRMTGYTAGGIPRSFGYDASGTRVWSQTGTGAKKFYIFDGDLLLGEVDSATGQMTAGYTWGANGLVSQRLASGSSWYHFGPQGETRQLTNAAGAITDSYFYAPYGATTATTGTTSNPFRYGGQFGYYCEADLYLCGARWYNPYLARWLSRDPIGYAGGPNLYEYCAANPVGFVDGNGRAPKGHHLVPIAVFSKYLPKGSAAYSAFDMARTDYKVPGGHGWSEAHARYNEAVGEMFDRWVKSQGPGFDPATMSAEDAKNFVDKVKNSRIPAVRGFLDDIGKAYGKKAAQCITEGSKDIADDLARAGRRASKSGFLSGLKFGLKKAGIYVTAAFFLYDWYDGGFANAVKGLVSPF